MRYFLIAGEASGDLHGSLLIKAIRAQDSSAEFRFWGGDLMSAQADGLEQHYKNTSFMGFVEVLKNIAAIRKLFALCKKGIHAFNPDIIIFIDYPGFNLRMAAWAHAEKYKSYYYIIPQVWAWKSGRVHQLKKYCNGICTILPFESEFLKNHGVDSSYYGHPLMEVISKNTVQEKQNTIALLPGSRKQEIKNHLPLLLKLTRLYPDYRFVIAGRREIGSEFYDGFRSSYPDVGIVWNASYALLESSKAAIISSGTASLEACLLHTPQVVIYKGNKLSYLIAKRLVHLKHISLVNIIHDSEVVKELIQGDFSLENLRQSIDDILENKNRIDQIKTAYSEVHAKLGTGNVSNSVAKEIIEIIKSESFT